jgi:hypothetical protein
MTMQRMRAEAIKTIIAEAKAIDSLHWVIGDALCVDIADCPNPNFRECVRKLKDRGFTKLLNTKITQHYLRDLYETAKRFPEKDRDPNIPWNVHCEARCAENLQRAARALRAIGKIVNRENMKWVMDDWRKNADAHPVLGSLS